LARHLFTIGAPIVEQFFRHYSQMNPIDLVSSPRIHLLNPAQIVRPHKYLHALFEIIIIDSSNLFIAFDYLPNWRQHPPHNELPYAFWLVRFLAGMQSGDGSVNVAMRCRPSI
jgi:hypothetical protein